MADTTDLACRSDADLTLDGFLGGRLSIRQPRRGHRSGTDAVLLAMAAPRHFAGHVVDVGAGVGVCGLGLACVAPNARVTLLERDPLTAALARDNAASNGLSDRVTVDDRDVLSPKRGSPEQGSADLVLSNPPFYEATRARVSPIAARRGAHVLGGGVRHADWLQACLGLLSDKGTLIVIHTPAAVPEILAFLMQAAGAITLLAVHPRAGTPARRVLVRATKGSRAPFCLAAPLILHDAAGFTPEAEAIHRGDASIGWAPNRD